MVAGFTPSLEHWQPATFAERGVAVGFTTPLLAGARVRLIDRRCDLIVPHPGGARGVYIVALASLPEFCTPTLHDRLLADRLLALNPICPSSVRSAACAVAREGAAGRAASEAAKAAEAADNARREAFEAALLASVAADRAHGTRSALLRLAGRTGRTIEAVQADIAVLASHLVATGLDLPAASPGASPGRGQALLGALEAAASEWRRWQAGSMPAPAAARLAGAAAAVAAASRLALAACQQLLSDPASLLGAWAAKPDQLAARLGRLDWLLDGWEFICLLWRVAETDAARADAIDEALVIAPPFPAEGAAWFPTLPPLHASLLQQQPAGPMPRAGGTMPSETVSLVARNERIRALAA